MKIIKRAYYKLWFIFFENKIIKIENYLFLCNKKNYQLRNAKILGFEKVFLNLLKLTNNQTVFIDIGANIGIASIMLSRKSKYCLSFEPNLSSFNRLVKNIEINNFDNIFPSRFCLYKESGFQDFTNTDFGEINRLIDLNSPVGKKFGEKEGNTKVFTNTFDNLITPLLQDQISSGQKILVKIDVETKELFLLEGAKDFLKLKIPIIVCIETNQRNQQELFIMLDRFGFNVITPPYGDDGINFFFTNQRI